MSLRKAGKVLLTAGLALALAAPVALAAKPIKIAQVVGVTGPYEAYTKQSITGFKMGLEYATNGTMKIDGRPIEVIIKDTALKPQNGKQLLTEAYRDDKVDLAVGPVSSAVAVAMLPVAQEFKKILIVEPAVADSITGQYWNRYIFRTGRNSSQDAVGNAAAVAKPGVVIATLAQDYSFGRDGVAAYKEAAEKRGAKVVHTEFVPATTADFTAPAQRIIKALKNQKGDKYLCVYWAGKNNPMSKLQAMNLDKKYGIKITAGGNILDALRAYKPMEGMEGATYYYYTNPKNKINDWLVAEHEKRFNGAPPDFFTCGGFAAAMAVVEAIKQAKSTDTEKLITVMEGMKFQTPKGEMMFRKQDHQAMQDMFHFRIKNNPKLPWAECVLVKVIPYSEMDIPIRNKK
ncbi:MAG: substrate-binding domain-containing protein [Proteobacteria bacterium]|nr:substrate-binding domain-containing protein [Pseudomonadota bacterium]MBU1451706.1 substrate-binding domain-containing protein [Pseudomonadota bacterium]MBU2467624.1 substrate-binding domain-containing protein [Pseudomonadota bacterium]MBU2516122.1 substrate-binding domain-containing protein [Pseudomonadota bacterium]